MKNILIIGAMIFSILVAKSQNNVTGIIKSEGDVPLVGATVYIPEMNRGLISDKNGEFELLNLPNGKIRIQFSYIGYTSHIETMVLTGQSKKLDIMLAQTAIEAEEIVVTGGYNATQHENVVKIDVLKLNTLLVKSTPNLTEMLSKVPGVDMISKGSGISKPVIRGLSMNNILVLNNGVRLENYQYSSHHPLGIDEFGIEKVEIIKGPASLLYGSDAIGGVINFIKEKPAPQGSIIGDYNLNLYSNTKGITQNLGVKGAWKNMFAGIRVGQKQNADFMQGGGDFVPNSRFNEQSIKANAGYIGAIGTFKMFYDYNTQNLGLVEDEAVETITKRGRENNIWYQNLNTHLLSSQNIIYFNEFKLDINSAFQNTELIHFGDVDEVEIQMNLSTLTYETKLHLPSNENSEYIIGIQGYNQENTNLNNRETILLPDATTNSISVFGMLQYTFFKKLKVQTGARFDKKTIDTKATGMVADILQYRPPVKKSYENVTGSFGATYYLHNDILLRSNFAAAYRTPNIAELTSNGQHELRFEIGDQNLVPEKAYETDISMHWHKGNFTIDVAGFYNLVNNYIYISPTGEITQNGIDIFRYKQANSFLYGGETGMHLHPNSLRWLHLETTFSSVVGKQQSGEFLPFIPAHKLNFEFRVEKERLMMLYNAFASTNIGNAFDQNNAAPDESPTNAYTLVDISFGGNVKLYNQLISIGLSANNIFDTKYIDHLSTLKEVNFYNPGRNISFSLRVPFGVSNRKE